jgi:hypothetical protein
MIKHHRFVGGVACATAAMLVNFAAAQTPPGTAQKPGDTALEEVVVTGS